MRRRSVLALLGAVLVVCSAASGGTASDTSLRIAFWKDGAGTRPDGVWTLTCSPASGSLARPVRACARLAAGGAKLFAPLPKNIVCTEIYGGPQRARVVGTVGGKRIWATFSRTNGCNIDRWQRVSPWLLPPGGIT
jgi:Subtilisin inhibitor-like